MNHLRHSYPKRMVHHLGRMDMGLIHQVVQGTQSCTHPLAQADDVAEPAILGNPQEQSQWMSTRRDLPIRQGYKRAAVHPMPTWTAMIRRVTYHEDQKR